jgi:hypothetical protein
VPHINPAIAWCKERQKANGIECAFLVLPFIKSVVLSQIPDRYRPAHVVSTTYIILMTTQHTTPLCALKLNLLSGDGALSDLQWLQGFKQMIEVFVFTDPATLGTGHIRLLHKVNGVYKDT